MTHARKRHPAHRHLQKLRLLKRQHYHPLIHAIHKKHNISKKTLFYVKEYGPHSNVPKTIIRESIRVLLVASLISSFGGLAIENIKTTFIAIVPLLILLPVLNDMIGNYGTVISSKFSTLLHEGKIKSKWWDNPELRKLFLQLMLISLFTAVFSSAAALAIYSFSSLAFDAGLMFRIIAITVLDVIILVSALFVVAVLAGIHFFRKGEDPNNFLIPITTSIADFGNMIVLSLLVVLLF
ncbi:MAG: magnesium transporter [Candidatus Aenigmatarchaeota archaeon]